MCNRVNKTKTFCWKNLRRSLTDPHPPHPSSSCRDWFNIYVHVNNGLYPGYSSPSHPFFFSPGIFDCLNCLLTSSSIFFGSGSGLIRIQEGKNYTQKKEKIKKFQVWSAGCFGFFLGGGRGGGWGWRLLLQLDNLSHRPKNKNVSFFSFVFNSKISHFWSSKTLILIRIQIQWFWIPRHRLLGLLAVISNGSFPLLLLGWKGNSYCWIIWPDWPTSSHNPTKMGLPNVYWWYPITETVFVNLLRSPGIDTSLSGRYSNPVCRTGPPGYKAWRSWFLRIDSWAPKRLQIRALKPLICDVRRGSERGGGE